MYIFSCICVFHDYVNILLTIFHAFTSVLQQQRFLFITKEDMILWNCFIFLEEITYSVI